MDSVLRYFVEVRNVERQDVENQNLEITKFPAPTYPT
jgi:hypothetical protein